MAMIQCSECQQQISDSAKTCPNCGFKRKHSWYENKVVVIVFLLIFFPVGVYGLWKNKNFGKVTKILLTCIIGFFLLIGIFSSDDTSSTSSSSNVKKQVEIQQAPKPKKVSNLDFYTIRKKIENMTEAQFNVYSRSIEGKRIKWTGWVEDVNEKMFGGYELMVDMDSPNELVSVQDVTFNIPENIALKISKNRKITFVGDVKSVLDIIGSCQVSLENIEIISY